MYLTDTEILELQDSGELSIEPFVKKKIPFKGLSYGLSSCGYDLRLGKEFLTYKKYFPFDPSETKSQLHPQMAFNDELIKPSIFNKSFTSSYFTIRPEDQVLGTTLEYVKMPNNVVGFIYDKSTWARLFLDTKNTVIEPGFEGNITLELSNRNPNALQLPIGAGIVQLMLVKLGRQPRVTYSYGKYQEQTGTTVPRGS